MNPIFTLSKGRLLLAVAIIASSLTACGQKGALYLPEANTSVVSPTPTPADDSTQPVVSANPQNPNVISNDPTDPATTATEQGTKDDY
jgi:predicted small lipoprotein YifL